MKNIFLTSSVDKVASDLVRHIDQDIQGKKLVYIDTATEALEDEDLSWARADEKALEDSGFDVYRYTLTDKSAQQVRDDLKDIDCIYLSGGNTFFLLYHIQRTNFSEFVHEQIKRGVIYIGTSAGSICAGPDTWVAHRFDSVKNAPKLDSYKGMGLVDFTILPHWGSMSMKELYMDHRLEHAFTLNNKLILLTDYQYVVVKDEWIQIVDVKNK